jgi:hypothetical protein
LCRLIANTLRQSFTELPGPQPPADGRKRRLEVIIDIEPLFKREGYFDDIGLPVILITHELSFGAKLSDERSYKSIKRFAPSIRVLDEDVHLLPVTMRSGGVCSRIHPGNCDLAKICGFYSTCKSSHSEKCEISMHRPESEAQLNVGRQ